MTEEHTCIGCGHLFAEWWHGGLLECTWCEECYAEEFGHDLEPDEPTELKFDED